MVEKFTENINSFDLSGGTEEAGILSYHNALNDPAKLSANQTDGCFRNDMVQVPIFMADENDMGAVFQAPTNIGCSGNATRSNGTTVNWSTVSFDNSTAFPDLATSFVTTPATNANYVNETCQEAEVRLRYYSEATPTGPGGTYKLNVTPQSLAADLIEYNGDLPSYGSAIIYNTTTFPHSSVESQGWGYFDFVDTLGFNTANLATANPNTQTQFNTQMNQIAQGLTSALTAVRIFTLNPGVCPGLEDGLVVKVNSTTLTTPAQYTYNATTEKVTIKAGVNIPLGALMSFEYVSCE